MTLYDRLSILAKKQGISIPQLSIKLGFSEQYLYKWKTNVPKADNLQKVADYFDVSVDYLLGRTNDPKIGLSNEKKKLTIEEALDSVMSYDGKPITDNDREILKKIAEAYLDGK